MTTENVGLPGLEKLNDLAALRELSKERQLLKGYLTAHGSLEAAIAHLDKAIQELEKKTGVKTKEWVNII